MVPALADLLTEPLGRSGGQGWFQLGELGLAFLLSVTIGLERQIRGKSAGMRTQAIVGTASALFLLVSKYGFSDVLDPGRVMLDPSRVAAQVVSGVGFLGAGLILTRRGSVTGLTTAASVWEVSAIGMAAGAGLPVLAVAVFLLHFVIVFLLTPLSRRVAGHSMSESSYAVTYEDGRGVLRGLLAAATEQEWAVTALTIADPGEDLGDDAASGRPARVTVRMRLAGKGAGRAAVALGGVSGVLRIVRVENDEDD